MSDTVTIRIPTALRPQTGNQESVAVAGASIKEVLGTLTRQYPELGKRLYKNDAEINRFINVYVNDEDIRFLENLETALKPGDEVAIVPAIAGG
jgi:sulfur-carrier protein